jgi:hypothetical protein
VSALLAIKETPVLGKTPVSAEVRQAALNRAVAEQAAGGWMPETNPEVERVLVGRNKFRRILVRRQWKIRSLRELVDVDKRGAVSIRRV